MEHSGTDDKGSVVDIKSTGRRRVKLGGRVIKM
jgi:hypothetical protein